MIDRKLFTLAVIPNLSLELPVTKRSTIQIGGDALFHSLTSVFLLSPKASISRWPPLPDFSVKSQFFLPPVAKAFTQGDHLIIGVFSAFSVLQ